MDGDTGYFDVFFNYSFSLPFENYVSIQYIVYEINCPDAPLMNVIYYPSAITIPTAFDENSLNNLMDMIEVSLQLIRTTIITVEIASKRIVEARRTVFEMIDQECHYDCESSANLSLGIAVKSIVLTANDASDRFVGSSAESILCGDNLDIQHALAESMLKTKTLSSRCLELNERINELSAANSSLKSEVEKLTTRCVELQDKNDEHWHQTIDLITKVEKSTNDFVELEKLNKENTFMNSYLKSELQKSAARNSDQEKKYKELWVIMTNLGMDMELLVSKDTDRAGAIDDRDTIISSLQESLRQSQSSAAELQNTVDELYFEIAQLEDTQKKIAKDMALLVQEKDDYIMYLEPLAKQYESYKSNDESCEQTIAEMMKEQTQLAERIDEYENKEKHLKQNLEKFTQSSYEMMNVIDALEQELANLKRRSQQDIEDMTSTSQLELEEYTRRYSKLHNEFCDIQETNRRLTRRLNEIETAELKAENESSEANAIPVACLEHSQSHRDEHPIITIAVSSALDSVRDLDLIEELERVKLKLRETENKLSISEKKLSIASTMMVGRVPLDRCQALESDLESTRRALEERVRTLTKVSSDNEMKFLGCKRDLDATLRDLEAANNDLVRVRSELSNSVSKVKYQALLSANEDYGSKLRDSEAKLKGFMNEMADQPGRLSDYSSRVDELAKQLAATRNEAETLRQLLRMTSEDHLKEQLSQKEDELLDVREELRRANNSTKDAVDELHRQKLNFRTMDIAYLRKIDELEAILLEKNSRLMKENVQVDADAIERLQIIRESYEHKLAKLESKVIRFTGQSQSVSTMK